MHHSRSLIIPVLLILLFSCTSDQDKKHAEDPVDGAKKVTISDVDKGIRANIASMTQDGAEYFNFHNDTLDLKLKLVRVHTEYLSVLGPNEFFACVDLATENGDVYDMDFFMKGVPGGMKVTRTDLHKLNGKPYYTWKQSEDKTWFTVPVQQATNDLLGVIEANDQFTFIYEVELPVLSGAALLWIPIPEDDPFQTVKITSLQVPGKHEMIQETDNGNTMLFVQLNPEHSKQNISISYQVDRVEKAPYIEERTNVKKYLEADALLPVGDRFATIADEVILKRQANTDLTKARALYDYIIDNMRYAKEGTYGTGDANYACDSRSGNCTEFHSFFISLARSAGIPARFAVGASIPSERDEGQVDGYHCWAEFYAEDKWWPVDISEANKYTPLATYFFGHHPANRIELSRGRDLVPEPGPQSGPINFMAYPVLEVDGKQVYTKTKFSFSRASKDS